MKTITLPEWAGSAAGGIVGLALAGLGAVALPIALPVGLAAGVGLDVWRHKRGHAVSIGIHPIVSGGLPSASGGKPPSVLVAKIRAASPIAAASTPDKVAAASAQAATAPPAEATRLHDYIVKYPMDRQVFGPAFYRNAPVPALVKDFQAAFNADKAAVAALGVLQVTGNYDAGTAAALSFYTHDHFDAPS